MLTPQAALQQYFGFNEFREGQAESIERTLKGLPTLLVMPTGSGKSLAYQLPALLLPGLTLVISPLIALMKDQVDRLTQMGISATYINSSLPQPEANERMRAVLEGHVKLLYVAPERLQYNQFMRSLARIKISLLAVDEAHCVSQWGHDFRPDYLRIAPTWEAMGKPTILATTATATPAVQNQIVELLGLEKSRIIVAGFNRPNLAFKVKYTPDERTKFQTLQSILQQTQGSAIVYAATRRACEEVADFINRNLRFPAQPYHAGLDRNLRYKVQDDFMADRLRVVVATNAFGMGVDKSAVRTVIHYHLPATVEAYYQEAGRAGRDGGDADCIMFYAPSDQNLQEFLIKSDSPSYQDMAQLYHILNRAARDGEAQATLQELAQSLNMHPTKLRVALSELELAGLLLSLGAQGFVNQWRVLPFAKETLQERDKLVQKRIENRLQLLDHMLNYAQLGSCRRKFLLNYFGDVSPPKSARCCDNHADDKIEHLPRAATPEEWYPLIVLETAGTLPRSVGRVLLADILMGSHAQKITQQGYDKHKFYGKLGTRLNKEQVVELINELIQHRYLQIAGSDKPVLEPSELGLLAVKHRAALPINIPSHNGPKVEIPIASRSRKANTVMETLELFQQGHAPSQIAQIRNITEVTIYNHLSKLITEGKITSSQIVPASVEQQILSAIMQVGSTEVLFPIKVLLPDEIDYNQIRCVVAGYVPPANGTPIDLAAVDPTDPIRRVVALGQHGDAQHVPELLTAMHHDDSVVRRLAASALGKMGQLSAVKPLLELLKIEPHPQVRQELVKALGQLGDARARPMLEQIAINTSETDYTTRLAQAALRRLG